MRSWWFEGSNWHETGYGSSNAMGGDPTAILNATGDREVFYFNKQGVLHRWWFSGSESDLEVIG
jgi:hypothetical protein